MSRLKKIFNPLIQSREESLKIKDVNFTAKIHVRVIEEGEHKGVVPILNIVPTSDISAEDKDLFAGVPLISDKATYRTLEVRQAINLIESAEKKEDKKDTKTQ